MRINLAQVLEGFLAGHTSISLIFRILKLLEKVVNILDFNHFLELLIDHVRGYTLRRFAQLLLEGIYVDDVLERHNLILVHVVLPLEDL